ncbi:MAG: response regulator [Cytophagales bacterium]
MNIMIIDDHDIALLAMQHQFMNVGFDSKKILIPSGFTALEYISNNLNNFSKLPRIILLDIQMPVLDGKMFLSKFSEIQNQLPFKIFLFVVTANDFDLTMLPKEHARLVTKSYKKPLNKVDILEIINLSRQ